MPASSEGTVREYIRAAGGLIRIPLPDDFLPSVEESFTVFWDRYLQLEAELGRVSS